MLKKEEILQILQRKGIHLSEDDAEKIPDKGVNPATKIHLDAIRY